MKLNEWLDKRGSLLIALTMILVTAAVAVIYLTGTLEDTSQNEKLVKQDASLTRTLCAQADVIATAFREPIPGETEAHFLIRMNAQQGILQASLGIDCGDTFRGLKARRAAALHELHQILTDANYNQNRGGVEHPAFVPDAPAQGDIPTVAPDGTTNR